MDNPPAHQFQLPRFNHAVTEISKFKPISYDLHLFTSAPPPCQVQVRLLQWEGVT